MKPPPDPFVALPRRALVALVLTYAAAAVVTIGLPLTSTAVAMGGMRRTWMLFRDGGSFSFLCVFADVRGAAGSRLWVSAGTRTRPTGRRANSSRFSGGLCGG